MQSLVLSVDFKKVSTEKNRFEVFSDFGSNPTGLDPLSWCKRGESYGAGEIIINSIDRDGSLMGYEIDLCKLLSKELTIPILISGAQETGNILRKVLLKVMPMQFARQIYTILLKLA